MRQGLLICSILLLLFSLGCTTTTAVVHSSQEIDFARQAVLELIAQSVQSPPVFELAFGELVPSEASLSLQRFDQVPGLRYLVDRYTVLMNQVVQQVSAQLPQFIKSEVLSDLEIEDPFSIVEGPLDSTTRFFAAQASLVIEQWATEHITSAAQPEALNVWDQLVDLIITFDRAYPFLYNEADPPVPFALSADPVKTAVVSLLRHLFANMSKQEALLRSMAPAYDNPLITFWAR
ncbi:MAG: hypothetical protein ACOXZ4_07270 [Sphaerochaetaceae bacterium]